MLPRLICRTSPSAAARTARQRPRLWRHAIGCPQLLCYNNYYVTITNMSLQNTYHRPTTSCSTASRRCARAGSRLSLAEPWLFGFISEHADGDRRRIDGSRRSKGILMVRLPLRFCPAPSGISPSVCSEKTRSVLGPCATCSYTPVPKPRLL